MTNFMQAFKFASDEQAWQLREATQPAGDMQLMIWRKKAPSQ
jgi:hypothetical protein